MVEAFSHVSSFARRDQNLREDEEILGSGEKKRGKKKLHVQAQNFHLACRIKDFACQRKGSIIVEEESRNINSSSTPLHIR